jgi:hypothetical protein
MMRRRAGFWVLWVLALLGMSGCTMSERRRNITLAGAAVGAAIGGGVGAAVGPNFGDGDGSSPPIPVKRLGSRRGTSPRWGFRFWV